jgi:hypothetical protein
MNKVLFIIFFLLFGLTSYSQEEVFNHRVSTDDVNIAPFRDVVCKFEQEKTIPASNTTIKSGGDFKFVLKKGVIFETLYPVKYTTSYSSKENKYVNDIIVGISKKNFSQIEKTFDIHYMKQNGKWVLGLVPKAETPASLQLKNIIIFGEKDIDRIFINTLNNGSTKLKFSNCQ